MAQWFSYTNQKWTRIRMVMASMAMAMLGGGLFGGLTGRWCAHTATHTLRKLAPLGAYRSFTGRINKQETVVEPLWLFFAASIEDMVQCALSST